jgi:hypothetical protein
MCITFCRPYSTYGLVQNLATSIAKYRENIVAEQSVKCQAGQHVVFIKCNQTSKVKLQLILDLGVHCLVSGHGLDSSQKQISVSFSEDNILPLSRISQYSFMSGFNNNQLNGGGVMTSQNYRHNNINEKIRVQ